MGALMKYKVLLLFAWSTLQSSAMSTSQSACDDMLLDIKFYLKPAHVFSDAIACTKSKTIADLKKNVAIFLNNKHGKTIDEKNLHICHIKKKPRIFKVAEPELLISSLNRFSVMCIEK